MRDLLVALLVFGSLPFIFYRPYIGILVWSWLGYMNPHRLAYGFAVDFPFAQIVAIVIIIALVFSKEAKRIPWTRETIVLAMFLMWMLITTLNAQFESLAWEQYIKIIKIQVMIFVTLMIMGSKDRLILMVWVIVLSLGFFGIKGGIFTITTGGAHRVNGPDGTFIGGNNELGLALIMIVPLMRYLQLTARRVLIKYGLTVAMLLTAVSIFGTHSRGALVGGAAMLLFLILKSRKKFVFIIMLAIAVPAVINFMPDHWFARMHTIETYKEDQSAIGRIDAWTYAFNYALDHPLVGGGFEMFVGRTDAHSIYFEVLGEHGFVGLGLFLLLGIFTWRTASWVVKKSKKIKELTWAYDLGLMMQVSLVGFASCGAFLGLAYFDLVYHIVAMVVLLRMIVTRKLAELAAENQALDSPEREPKLSRASG